MPARQPTGSNRNPRRRPAPVMPGGWMWLVLIVTVVIMLFVVNNDGGIIGYSDFLQQVDKGNVDKVVFHGDSSRVTGEFKKLDDLPESVRNQVRKDNRFT